MNGQGVVKSVTLKWNKQALDQIDQKFKEGVFDLATSIGNNARDRAPYVTGALRNSIRLNEEANGINVIAGGIINGKDHRLPATFGFFPPVGYSIDYAMKREKGPNRDPATVGYMANAQAEVMQGDWIKKFFGGITKK